MQVRYADYAMALDEMASHSPEVEIGPRLRMAARTHAAYARRYFREAPNGHLAPAMANPMGVRFRMSNPIRLLFAATFLSLLREPAHPNDGNAALGKKLAQEWCAKCHAIGRIGESPLQVAPPFRELHLRYNVEDLTESLAEGIMTGHPAMPVFRFDPDQIRNLIAYLKTLEKR